MILFKMPSPSSFSMIYQAPDQYHLTEPFSYQCKHAAYMDSSSNIVTIHLRYKTNSFIKVPAHLIKSIQVS